MFFLVDSRICVKLGVYMGFFCVLFILFPSFLQVFFSKPWKAFCLVWTTSKKAPIWSFHYGLTHNLKPHNFTHNFTTTTFWWKWWNHGQFMSNGFSRFLCEEIKIWPLSHTAHTQKTTIWELFFLYQKVKSTKIRCFKNEIQIKKNHFPIFLTEDFLI